VTAGDTAKSKFGMFFPQFRKWKTSTAQIYMFRAISSSLATLPPSDVLQMGKWAVEFEKSLEKLEELSMTCIHTCSAVVSRLRARLTRLENGNVNQYVTLSPSRGCLTGIADLGRNFLGR